MNSNNDGRGEGAGSQGTATREMLLKARWALSGLVVGLLAGAWAGGGTDRYGQEEGFVGGLKGACASVTRGCCYTAATIRECVSHDRSSVRKLGLGRQIENRLLQDKKLAADLIVVAVEEDGVAVLTGQVQDEAQKDRAVALVRDTRGVSSVVDQLAMVSEARTIAAPPASMIATDLAPDARTVR